MIETFLFNSDVRFCNDASQTENTETLLVSPPHVHVHPYTHRLSLRYKKFFERIDPGISSVTQHNQSGEGRLQQICIRVYHQQSVEEPSIPNVSVLKRRG